MKLIRYADHGKGNMGWLQSTYHFSFANYVNPNRRHIGPLRVINDDYIAPRSGFNTHPHRDMEIITYVINGTLTHVDSMNNTRKLSRHGVQYMSAGTGVQHSEHNHENEELHIFQTWIFPREKGLTPNYGDFTLQEDTLQGQLVNIVSGEDDDGLIHIHQHASIKVGMFEQNQTLDLPLGKYSHSYLVLIDGELMINTETVYPGDSVELDQDTSIQIIQASHIFVVQV